MPGYLNDRLLLESGNPDGIQLEDGSGVLGKEGPYGPYYDAVIADAPNAYYRLGEASGSLIDMRGGTSGTANGTFTQDVAGALVLEDDGAIALAGTGYITVASNAALDTGDTFSLECWVKRDAINTSKWLFHKVGSYDLLFDSGANLNKIVVEDYGNVVLATSSVTILDTTTWHHIVFTKATTTSKIYIDGADVTTVGTNGTVTNSANALGIGGTAAGASTFDGSMDEVAIYPTALTAVQVLNHYQLGAGTYLLRDPLGLIPQLIAQ